MTQILKPTDALVKAIDDRLKRYLGSCGDGGLRQDVEDIIRAAMSHHPDPDELREALERDGRALNALIECVGFPMKSRTHYRWARFPTFAEVQEAMEANNNAATALSRNQGDVG